MKYIFFSLQWICMYVLILFITRKYLQVLKNKQKTKVGFNRRPYC